MSDSDTPQGLPRAIQANLAKALREEAPSGRVELDGLSSGKTTQENIPNLEFSRTDYDSALQESSKVAVLGEVHELPKREPKPFESVLDNNIEPDIRNHPTLMAQFDEIFPQ